MGLRPKQVKPLTSCTEVIRLLGSIKFAIQGMKQAVEKASLVVPGDADAEIDKFQVYPFCFFL
ncbi:MAG: hypothetical protein H6Q48_3022 [Deltaproteobacteria bacterium]|nr:hypothetical protein [Deltaproteobacteria bacterium]